MHNKKAVVVGIASVAVVGILSYLGYRVMKELNELDLGNIDWENIDDVYHYRQPTSKS